MSPNLQSNMPLLPSSWLQVLPLLLSSYNLNLRVYISGPDRALHVIYSNTSFIKATEHIVNMDQLLTCH